MIQSLLRINQKQIIAAEYITVLAGFLFYTGALPTILTDTFGVPSQLFTLMRYGITLPGLLLILLQPKHILQQIIHGKYAWFIMLLGMLCFLWSSNPPIPLGTIRSELLPMALFSLYVAARIPLKMQFNLIGLTMKFVSLTSVFYALFLPHIGVHHEKWPGAWKGNHSGGHGGMGLTGVSRV